MDHEVPQVLVVQRVLMVLEAQLAHLVDKESKATAVQAGEKELMAQEEKTVNYAKSMKIKIIE